MVEADLSDDIPNLVKLRRYARSLQRQMQNDIDQFYVEHPEHWDDPNRKPAFIAQACIDRERKQTWSFAEPDRELNKPKPTLVAEVVPTDEVRETKPHGIRPKTAVDKTKPSRTEIDRAACETKPSLEVVSGWIEPALGRDHSNVNSMMAEPMVPQDPVHRAGLREPAARRSEPLPVLVEV